MNLDVFYLGALLHDIGKFIERTKGYGDIKEKERYRDLDTGWAHPKYSDWWLDFIKDKIPLFEKLQLRDKDFEDIKGLVLWHHRPKSFWEEVLQTSDHLSAGERRGDEEEKGKSYYEEPLLSIFSEIFMEKEEYYYYPLKKLEIDESAIFPKRKSNVSVNYDELERDFESNLINVHSEEDLLALLERYLWCVPSQVVGAKPDISLYDHLRTTSAIAVAYWNEIRAKEKEGEDYWRDRLKQVRELLSSGRGSIKDEADFLLVGGDLSGIQSFIFDIPSTGAAKSLKGRSLFLSLLMRVVASYIIRKLNLRLVNILYIGGGAFWILAHISAEDELKRIKRDLSKILLKALKGKIYIALAWIPLRYKYFSMDSEENFSKAFMNLQRELSRAKMERFKEVLELEDGYELLFGSPGTLSSYEDHCLICGENKKELLETIEEGQNICKMCNSFIELCEEFSNRDFISLKECEETYDISDCFSLFKAFGYEVEATSLRGKESIYLKDPSLKRPENLTLEKIAEESEGDDLLGYVKIDVDSLGRIFREGLGKVNYSVSRVANLSRMLALFFEKYIPEKLISDRDYLVFAGGDDAFIISRWDRALKLAKEIEDAFREYVAFNPKVTFSVGIFFAKPKFPVSRSASIVEGELHQAKSKSVEKNGVCIWGEVFTKEEYEAILNLWRKFKDVFAKERRAEARASLFKVISFSREFKGMGDETKLPKPWLLAYALRNVEDKDFRDYVVDLYERLPFRGEVEVEGKIIEVKNPAILYIASCLTYLSTREVRKG